MPGIPIPTTTRTIDLTVHNPQPPTYAAKDFVVQVDKVDFGEGTVPFTYDGGGTKKEANYRGQVAKVYGTTGTDSKNNIVLRTMQETWDTPKSWNGESGFWIDTQTIAEILKTILLDKPTGLIVVCGATGSGKTTHVHCLMQQFVTDQLNELQNANPAWNGKPGLHVVTSEDQFEGHLLEENKTRSGLSYTPRLRVEGESHQTEQHLLDALRQKPGLVYMGEVRGNDDWKHIIKFAGTGHLVVATAHATGLKEIFSTLLQSLPEQTKYWRTYLANRICAVIHVRTSEINDRTVSLIRYWRGSSVTRAEYIKSGDMSLRPVATDRAVPNQISYSTFARKAEKELENRLCELENSYQMQIAAATSVADKAKLETEYAALKSRAIPWPEIIKIATQFDMEAS